MVSIQYGGGPTLEQREKFCNLRPGSHIPGYYGYVPQLKYCNGKTFGHETYDCARKLAYYNGPTNQKVSHFFPHVGPSKYGKEKSLFTDEVPVRKLPIPTGDNKYTEKMMPGYSGDIPKSLNKFGGTYRSICDECVNEFITDYERNKAKQADLTKMSTLFPKLRPICGDPRVRDHINLWSDSLMKNSVLATDRRSLTEPPMPGYSGYIPRMNNTELGLAARYHQASGRSLETFKDEIDRHFHRYEQKYNVKNVADQKPLSLQAPTEPRFSRRIFNKDGMIPAYTGHIHRSKEEMGYTVGDTTRSLEVCKHDFPCYGEYVRNKDIAVELNSSNDKSFP